MAATQLRQALYARMGRHDDIHEEFPEWSEDGQEVVWTQQVNDV